MTPRTGLYVALLGLLTVVLSVGGLCLADASGQPKPTVERTLMGLSGGFGLIVMVVGLIVHGHFVSRLFGILVGAFVAFGVGAVGYAVLDCYFSAPGYGLMGRDELGTSHEEGPIAIGSLAGLGWLILAGTLWGNIRKVR
jgi:hypothetical protein